jgi:hypothetical protein
MLKASLTIIRNTRGPLSKSLSLKDRRLIKSAAADLTEGTATRIEVTGLSQLATVIDAMTARKALTFGVTGHKTIRIITQEALRRGAQGALCRDRRHFAWPDGRGVLMLDIDKPKDGSAPLKAKSFDAALCDILPWWRGIARMYRPSASAFIYDEAGNELGGAGSLRCYAIVDHAKNIPFIGIAITDALWKAGMGRIEFSAAGSMLLRCPVDGAVWQPERLDFAGPVVLGAGLVKRKFPPWIIEGADIDTEAAIADGPGKITYSAWSRVSLEVRKAREAARPEEKRRRATYIDKRVKADVSAGLPEKAARAKWRQLVTSNTLTANFILHFRDKGDVTVADVLRDPYRYDRERLADPAEPGYARDSRIAVFYANTGHARPHVFSHAHGGVKYVISADGARA